MGIVSLLNFRRQLVLFLLVFGVSVSTIASANQRLCRIYTHGKLSLKNPATSEQGLQVIDSLVARLHLNPNAIEKRSKSLYVSNDNIDPEKIEVLSEHLADLRDDLVRDHEYQSNSSKLRRKHREVMVTINLLSGKAAIDEYNRSYLKMARVLKRYISPTNNRAKAERFVERTARTCAVGYGIWLGFEDLLVCAGELMFGEQDLEVLLDSSQYVGYGIGVIALAALYPRLKDFLIRKLKLGLGRQAFASPPARVFEKSVAHVGDYIFESHSERSDNVPWIGNNMHSALDRISYRADDGTPVMLIISRLTVARR
jgi:hypothetical protein